MLLLVPNLSSSAVKYIEGIVTASLKALVAPELPQINPRRMLPWLSITST